MAGRIKAQNVDAKSIGGGIPLVVSGKGGAGDLFPIVGIGASAGGLEAFEQFFSACPVDSGMAFVLVPHLDPNHQSLLTEILQRTTGMPVLEAIDQAVVLANHVYIIPPNREMAIFNGVLQLSEPSQVRGQRLPIDAFLRSLADDQGDQAIGIVLSGTATDGTLGLRAILGAGGICMVQEPSTAKYDGMPRSAISAGYATHILPVGKMPAFLLEIIRQSVFRQRVPRILPAETVNGLNQILLQVRNVTGHDFLLYKKSTVGRRVERRMSLHHIDDMAVYARFLKDNPTEVQALFKELLINVTSFFRDPEAFAELKDVILPRLIADKPDDYVFRVWVAGCASGEEAYSIAMLLWEVMEASHKILRVQIYATDLDDDVIVEARSGRYPPNIAQDVSAERLERFFIKDEAGYKVARSIRDMVIFAVQSVIKDPPFTKLDLLSCRNLMIYLEPEQQERLIPNFHFALRPGGVLFLSSSESITNHPDLFRVLHRKWKFYEATNAVPSPHISLSARSGRADKLIKPSGSPVVEKPKARTGGSVADLSNRILLQSYAPASVTTDQQGNILFVHGDIRAYVAPPPGPVTTNVLEMVRDELKLDLRAAILNAVAQGVPTLNKEVPIENNASFSAVSLSVRPLPASGGGDSFLLISFQDVAGRVVSKRSLKTAEAGRFEQMEHELAYAKENLQATIEAQQATNEELKSTNEELQSTNEELQSANEELETSKEELQSLNEETITVNAELSAKVDQLNGMQNDLKNLMDNVHTGTLFLDHELTIRRYTREATKIYRLVDSDIGRVLGDIKSSLVGTDLLAELRTVLETLIPFECEVSTVEGAWYLARIQPYRTLDNFILGVVLTFTEVTDFKRVSEAVQRSETLLAIAQEIAQLGSWEMDVVTGDSSWSEEMYRIFGYPHDEKQMSTQDVLNTLSPEDQERVEAGLRHSVDTRGTYDMEYRITRSDGAKRDIRSRAIPVVDASGRVTRLLGTSLDITEIREAERMRAGQQS